MKMETPFFDKKIDTFEDFLKQAKKSSDPRTEGDVKNKDVDGSKIKKIKVIEQTKKQ